MENQALSMKNIRNAIINVTNGPAHKVDLPNSEVNALYTQKMYDELAEKVYDILSHQIISIPNTTEIGKVMFLNDYVMNHVRIRREYFDAFNELIPELPSNELYYRTAHAALITGEAMCTGYTEATRILLESIGIKTSTLLSRLPGKNKRLLHYVTLVTLSTGYSFILDPERQASCIHKGYNFDEYKNGMYYIIPTNFFCNNKIGTNGVGTDINTFFEMAINNQNLIFIDDENNNSSNLPENYIANVVYDNKYSLNTSPKSTNNIPSKTNGENGQNLLSNRVSEIACLDDLINNPIFYKYIEEADPVIFCSLNNVGSLQKIIDFKNNLKERKNDKKFGD